MSLLFINIIDMCQDTLGVLDILHSTQNYSEDFIDYDCGEEPPCDVNLTGSSRKTSLQLTIPSEIPKLRLCATECVNSCCYFVSNQILW